MNRSEVSDGSRAGHRASCQGFSLIEVTLALMVIGVGILSVFQLFPSGLRSSIDATAETRVGQFADEVLNQIYADAAAETNSVDWQEVFSGSVDIDLNDNIELDLPQDEWTKVEYPDKSGEFLRYKCDTTVNDDLLAQLELSVKYGVAGGIEQKFYIEVYNFGM
jgi:prepilin-type N-terminal cleavage/methylation domain-containing protein